MREASKKSVKSVGGGRGADWLRLGDTLNTFCVVALLKLLPNLTGKYFSIHNRKNF